MVDQVDPLASPTLAQLYVTQGHYERATRVLKAVLAADPANGHALALKKRLAARRGGEVKLERSAVGLAVHYRTGLRTGTGWHVVVETWGAKGGGATPRPLTSQPCPDRDGELSFTAPPGPGSASACLARLSSEGRLEVVAVAEPLTW